MRLCRRYGSFGWRSLCWSLQSPAARSSQTALPELLLVYSWIVHCWWSLARCCTLRAHRGQWFLYRHWRIRWQFGLAMLWFRPCSNPRWMSTTSHSTSNKTETCNFPLLYYLFCPLFDVLGTFVLWNITLNFDSNMPNSIIHPCQIILDLKSYVWM